MPFVLQRIEDRKYVAPAGSAKSYTRSVDKARIFATRNDAEANKCGNERIIPVTTTPDQ